MSQGPNRSTDPMARSNITAKAVSEPTGSNTSEDLKFRNVAAEIGMTEGGAIDNSFLKKDPAEPSTPELHNAKPERGDPRKKNLSDLLAGKKQSKAHEQNAPASPDVSTGSASSDMIDDLDRLLQEAVAAKEYTPVPPGRYKASLVSTRTKSRTSSRVVVEAVFGIEEAVLGIEDVEAHKGRHVWYWLIATANNLAYVRRDLDRLGMRDTRDFDKPVDRAARFLLQLGLRTDDSGKEWNKVLKVERIASEPQGPDPFAPENVDGPSGGAL